MNVRKSDEKCPPQPLKKIVQLMSLLDREKQAWPYDKTLLERLDQRQ